ncbi:hypothetical protein IE53DRAFT_42921 [Violaceomyces palustris]|uniref:Uncharacterized protein n=1 Tax=Violaceomyces palustris TaxID=1673888 RepID=A0ACD0P0L9_9BASI|nr:hypothetical protein IE53DRAFT_42921 [Violaceomyces palustris]
MEGNHVGLPHACAAWACPPTSHLTRPVKKKSVERELFLSSSSSSSSSAFAILSFCEERKGRAPLLNGIQIPLAIHPRRDGGPTIVPPRKGRRGTLLSNQNKAGKEKGVIFSPFFFPKMKKKEKKEGRKREGWRQPSNPTSPSDRKAKSAGGKGILHFFLHTFFFNLFFRPRKKETLSDADPTFLRFPCWKTGVPRILGDCWAKPDQYRWRIWRDPLPRSNAKGQG